MLQDIEQMDSASLLDQPITLGEILDQDSLQRVCMTFARLHGTGMAVIDSRGQVLVDIPAEHPLCRRIRSHPRGADICGAFDTLIQSAEVDVSEAPLTKSCLCGLCYEMLAIRHQGVVLGRLIYGPYRSEGLDELPDELVDALGENDSKDSEELVEAARVALRKMPPQKAHQVVRALGEVLSVIVQTGYARHLTSQIHIAAIQEAYNELQEKNRRLADSLDKLKELDKLKSNFLATISHELRTPLTSVIGYSEMLLEGLAGELSKEQRDYVQTIMEKGDQLLQIISEILDISKIESGSVQLSCEQIDVSALLRQVSDAMMPQARRKKIALQYDTGNALLSIYADRSKTRQVLLNLFSNAIKFTPEGGRVLARVGRAEISGGATTLSVPAVEVRVSDTGIGVPQESRERIFDAFYQVDSSSTRSYGGTGLGLSIVKHFVEAHGGKVWVEGSPEGAGSVFVVRLPIAPRRAQATKAPSRSQMVG